MYIIDPSTFYWFNVLSLDQVKGIIDYVTKNLGK